MGKKLYVGNLNFAITDEMLQQLFADCGTVETAEVIKDRYSGRSKGFGFVEFSNDTEANAAIEKLNGKDYEGRPLTVSEARPKEKREGGFGGGRGGGFGGGGRRDSGGGRGNRY